MESLLTSTAETLVIGFALLMAIDFFSGLVQLYRSTPLQTQPHDEPETESAMPEGLQGIQTKWTSPLTTIIRGDMRDPAYRACPLCPEFLSGYALIGIGSLSDRLAVPPEDNGSSQMPTLLESACDEIERVASQTATLSWLETTIKTDMTNTTETPNVIEMARVRLHKAQVRSRRTA